MDLSNNDIFKPPNNKNKAGRTGEGEGFEGETSRHRRLSLAHCLEGGNGQHGGGSSSCDILRLPYRVALAEDMVARADSPHFRLLGKRE
jgi:hypothetical protein